MNNPSELSDSQHRSRAFTVVLAAGFMSLLGVSVVNVALPSIEFHLHASPTQLQWILAGFALSFGLTLVPAGKAGDIFGRKILFLVGVAGFMLASLAGGLAPTANWLVAARLVQGGFAGVMNPQVVGLIQDLFQGRERAKAFGAYGAVVGVSTAVGPLVGGLLLDALGPEIGWRAVFLVNVPFGAALIALIALWVPRDAINPEGRGESLWRQFDPVGLFLLGAVVVLVMWPFLESSDSGSAGLPPDLFWFLGAAVVGSGLLLVWERHWHSIGGSALLDPRLAKSPSYLLGLAAGLTYFAGFTSVFVVFTLFLQQGLGFTPLQAGLAQMPFALLSAISAGMSGRLVSRYGRTAPLVGSAIVVVGMFATAGVAIYLPGEYLPATMIVIMGLTGLGSGLIISPNQTLTLESAPRSAAGMAGAVLQTLQRMGTAIGMSVVTTVFFVTVDSHPGEPLGEAMRQGFANSMLVVAVIVTLTFIVNLADRLRRKELPLE